MIPKEPGRVALDNWIASQPEEKRDDEVIEICKSIFDAPPETRLMSIPSSDFFLIEKEQLKGLSQKTARLFEGLRAINQNTGPFVYDVHAIREPNGCFSHKCHLQGRWIVRPLENEDEFVPIGLIALISGMIGVMIATAAFAIHCVGHSEINTDDIDEEDLIA